MPNLLVLIILLLIIIIPTVLQATVLQATVLTAAVLQVLTPPSPVNDNQLMPQFDHEKLNVYQRSLDFVEFADATLESIPKSLAVHSQLDRASTSIPLNIAEGNGKFTSKDRCHFFDIARGSALECASALDVLLRKKRIEREQAEEGKAILVDVVSLLVGLIRSQGTDRVFEESAGYNVD